MEDETIKFKVTITGDGSKILEDALEQALKDAVEKYGIITSYDIKEITK